MEVLKINTMTRVMIIIETTEVEDRGVVAINKDTEIGLRKETTKIIVTDEVAKNGMTEVNMMALQGIKNMVAIPTSSATKNLISRQSITIQTIANTMSIVMNFSKRSFLKNQVLSSSKYIYSKVKAQNPTNLSQAIIKEMIATRNSN